MKLNFLFKIIKTILETRLKKIKTNKKIKNKNKFLLKCERHLIKFQKK